MPIQNAVVLIDRGDGTLERAATSDTGVVVFGTTTPTRIVIVYSDAANSWRVTDLAAIPPGTVVHVGARPSTNTDHATTMTLPTAGTPQYRVMLPGRCGYSANTSGTAVHALYVSQCEGQSVHVIAEASDASTVRGFDAGQVTLTNHGAASLSGAYMLGQTYTINITNVPNAAIAGGGALDAGLAILDPDFGMIGLGDHAYVTATGANATLMPKAEPLGNALAFGMYGGPGAYLWTTSSVSKRTITAAISADANDLLPMFTALSLPPSAAAASWTLAPATSVAPVLYAYEADIAAGNRRVRWTAYRGPGATALQFPMLPADLAAADPTNGTWADVSLVGIAYPGASYAALIPTIDRDWPTWGARVTSDNFDYSQIVYSAGLGPP